MTGQEATPCGNPYCRIGCPEPGCPNRSAGREATPPDPFWRGARLGWFQAHALVMTPGAAFLLGHGDYLPAALFGAAAAFGWFAWWSDYRLAWRLR